MAQNGVARHKNSKRRARMGAKLPQTSRMSNYYNLKSSKTGTHQIKSRQNSQISKIQNSRQSSRTRNKNTPSARQSSSELFDGLRRKLKKISTLRGLDKVEKIEKNVSGSGATIQEQLKFMQIRFKEKTKKRVKSK